jgi:hypothetical protein
MRLSFASLALSLVLAACGGGDDDADTGVGPTPDGDTTVPDSGGGLPDSDTTGGPDARPVAENAMYLGQLCGATACPDGYVCLVLVAGATTGQCSLPCPGDIDGTCQDMFPGPGTAMCDFTLTDTGENFCAIRCGNQWSPVLPTDCPTGLVCSDLTGSSGTPDTLLDFCAPPPR